MLCFSCNQKNGEVTEKSNWVTFSQSVSSLSTDGGGKVFLTFTLYWLSRILGNKY